MKMIGNSLAKDVMNDLDETYHLIMAKNTIQDAFVIFISMLDKSINSIEAMIVSEISENAQAITRAIPTLQNLHQ